MIVSINLNSIKKSYLQCHLDMIPFMWRLGCRTCVKVCFHNKKSLEDETCQKKINIFFLVCHYFSFFFFFFNGVTYLSSFVPTAVFPVRRVFLLQVFIFFSLLSNLPDRLVVACLYTILLFILYLINLNNK